MSSSEAPPAWLVPVAALISSAGRRGGFLVAFPEYRPLLVRLLAEELDLEFMDYRAECMAPHGWEAGQLPLSALDQAIGESLARSGRGVVVHNAEALLATKSEQDRRSWLAALVAGEWYRPVILPISLFQGEMPPRPQRVHRLEADTLPPESLLVRLASR